MIRLNRGLKEAKMGNLQRMVGLTMLCSLLLAGCEGSGGGGGSPGIAGMTGAVPPSSPGTMPPSSPGTVPPSSPGTMPPSSPGTVPPSSPGTMPPSSTDPLRMSYGAWNQEIRDAFPAIASCTSGCSALFPAAPARIRSPFGETAAFDPSQDQWAATWTGQIEGYRNSDPDLVGSGAGRHWTGTAKLEIQSTDLSRVRFWGEDLLYDLESGGRSGLAPDKIPDSRASPWFATLSTAAGQKGYFVGSGDHAGLHGQFDAAAAGVTPSRAIGHISSGGQTGVFKVER